jgi:DNA-binding MarR family transcriptional regulator
MPRRSDLHHAADSRHTSPDSPEHRASDEELLFRYFTEIGIIHQLASTAFQRVLPHALTGAQFTVLNHCVRTGDNKTPAQLAEILQVTRGTLTSTLARLESKGFIRMVPDDLDGRSKRVLLTARGRQAREESIKASWPLLARVRTVLSRTETEQQLPQLAALREWLDRNRKF